MLQASRGRPKCAICSVASSVEVMFTSFFVMLQRLARHALMLRSMVDDIRHAATTLIPQCRRTSSRTLCIGETLGSKIHAVPRSEIFTLIAATIVPTQIIQTTNRRTTVNWLFGIFQDHARIILVKQFPSRGMYLTVLNTDHRTTLSLRWIALARWDLLFRGGLRGEIFVVQSSSFNRTEYAAVLQRMSCLSYCMQSTPILLASSCESPRISTANSFCGAEILPLDQQSTWHRKSSLEPTSTSTASPSCSCLMVEPAMAMLKWLPYALGLQHTQLPRLQLPSDLLLTMPSSNSSQRLLEAPSINLLTELPSPTRSERSHRASRLE